MGKFLLSFKKTKHLTCKSILRGSEKSHYTVKKTRKFLKRLISTKISEDLAIEKSNISLIFNLIIP